MLIDFFQTVRAAGVPASVREYLDLLRALQQGLVFADADEFYALARLCLVKDEKYYDRFDRAFAAYFSGLESFSGALEELDLPDDWLRKELERVMTEAQKAEVQGLGSLDKILEALRERLENQTKRHQGGSKNIGTGGTSAFGAFGYNPEGIRIEQGESRHRKAVKVWEERNYRNLDDSIELGIRNIKVALRRLRQFARQGAADQLDLDDTIRSTAQNAGYLDLKLVPERHNAVKVLLFFDVGGSMDEHIRACEELFSAARAEFKHMEGFYFHNCVYESVWRNNNRRHQERISTWDVLHKYGSDYKVIFVGDASMAPYEVTHVGGSVEHYNDEAGAVWLQRITQRFPHVVWLNPTPQRWWGPYGSLGMIQQLMENRMYPLTVEGITAAIKELT
ncbi:MULTISPECIES: VWA domain-containing protein [unclassified Oceanobacter]|uniref:vWA domain-containing protein n=1 Tax=unclassified Oceanobacter TaxID=2620260 RepID=UPI002736E0D8|nr:MULTISPECIES: VWA domain-containing protein [unclassified Oceanobacter]MDP2504785.1 VWA domain-containing protein [Oceanobacter sp. 3_MG-2023]MDP2607530.1 VWA domain-containing protein [Oceanobacter sp. 1_MG-2023]MDP2610798.1 VWA domain-containing protein [Oceanobacter sp. 2_MG-2023]